MVVSVQIAQIPSWAVPILTARLIDLAIVPGADRAILYTGLLLLGSIALNFPMALVFHYFMSRVTRSIGHQLRISICRQLQQLTLLYHSKTNIGPLNTKAVRDIELIEKLPRILSEQLLNIAVTTAIAFFSIIRVSLSASAVFVLLIGSAVMFNRVFQKALKRSVHTYRTSMEQLSSSLQDMMVMIPVTRAHGLEEHQISTIERSIDHVATEGRKFDIYGGRFSAGAYVSIALSSAIFLLFSIWIHRGGHISIGEVVMFNAFFTRIAMGVQQLLNLLPQLTQTREALYSIDEVLSTPDLELNRGKKIVSGVRGAFCFDALSFAYPNSNHPALHDIELSVSAGESIGFAGPSGCGKSTLLSVIIGFIRPQSGRILLDGCDMQQLDLRSVRRHIGVVSQDTVFFSGTIAQNVAYGSDTIDEEKVRDALHKAQILDLIETLPRGIHTPIGAEGIALSGGQRQRISIARALVRDPRILILDEATSALDAQTEMHLQQVLDSLMQGRTTFIVSHRLASFINTDRIVILREGHIEDVGNHTQLLQHNQFYRTLSQLQSRGGQPPQSPSSR
jgi:ATP-binding cassette subfamily B protein